MKRQFNPAELELMDRPQPVSAELESDLENIRELNRWFGSYALISMFLGRWIKPGSRLRIVDLATGSGDIPRLIAECGRKIGAELRIDAIRKSLLSKETSWNGDQRSHTTSFSARWRFIILVMTTRSACFNVAESSRTNSCSCLICAAVGLLQSASTFSLRLCFASQ